MLSFANVTSFLLPCWISLFFFLYFSGRRLRQHEIDLGTFPRSKCCCESSDINYGKWPVGLYLPVPNPAIFRIDCSWVPHRVIFKQNVFHICCHSKKPIQITTQVPWKVHTCILGTVRHVQSIIIFYIDEKEVGVKVRNVNPLMMRVFHFTKSNREREIERCTDWLAPAIQ